MLFGNLAERRKQHQRELDADRKQLAPALRSYLEDVEKRYSSEARKLAKERDKRVAELEKRLAPRQAQFEKLQRELDEAKRNTRAIPASAEPGDVAAWLVVVDKWPERLQEASESAGAIRADINRVNDTFAHDMRRVQARLSLELEDAQKALRKHAPNVHELLEG